MFFTSVLLAYSHSSGCKTSTDPYYNNGGPGGTLYLMQQMARLGGAEQTTSSPSILLPE